MKRIILFIFMLFILTSCNTHECVNTHLVYPDNYDSIKCGESIEIDICCDECGKKVDSKVITKEHSFKEEVISPTCTNNGYTLVTCEKCDYEEKKNEVTLLDHEIIETEVLPTCKEEGYILSSCKNCEYSYKTPKGERLEHTYPEEDEWVVIEDNGCDEFAIFAKLCVKCQEVLETYEDLIPHDLEEVVVDPTCTERGYIKECCKNCDYERIARYTMSLGHQNVEYVVDKEATIYSSGIRHLECKDCNHEFAKVNYYKNGFNIHGKLSVNGRDLVDRYNSKFQLIGLSTHGLQWEGDYVHFETFEQIHSEFGINVIRLALYTSEGGYCEASITKKKELYDLVCKGIDYATRLDMYVIVDWHMVGAEDPNDKNPLYYLDEAKEFFGKISEQYKDHDNILYEIMNEPCGTTTWEDCKKYANEVIPIIRKNTDAIVLVGNPLWTADLISVMNSPLEGYENIMYTYHFYAADHKNTSEVEQAYDKGFPVFISEHGGMLSSGDGDLDIEAVTNWYKVLDERNISYVAWNISNTKGSASILKTDSTSRINFTDSALKPWGIWYKEWVKAKMNK